MAHDVNNPFVTNYNPPLSHVGNHHLILDKHSPITIIISHVFLRVNFISVIEKCHVHELTLDHSKQLHLD